MAAPWMSPTRWKTTRPSGDRTRAEVQRFPQDSFCGGAGEWAHVLRAAHLASYAIDELTLVEKVIPSLRKGMLCMADRFFPSLWRMAAKTGADLLWRTRQNAGPDVEKRLTDSSYLAEFTHPPPTGGMGVTG